MRWSHYSAWDAPLQPRNKLLRVTGTPAFWLQPPRMHRSLKKWQKKKSHIVFLILKWGGGFISCFGRPMPFRARQEGLGEDATCSHRAEGPLGSSPPPPLCSPIHTDADSHCRGCNQLRDIISFG